MKTFTEMDAGEQREDIANMMAFGTQRIEQVYRKAAIIGGRIGQTRGQVIETCMADARQIEIDTV